MRVLLLLLALAGCDRVFGLGDPYEDARAPGSDAVRPVDATGDATHDAPADADGRIPQPLAHYRFDGTYAEASSGAPATCTTSAGGACGFDPGKYGMALHLDGSSIGEITLPSLPPTFTLILWVKYGSAGPVLDLAQSLASPSTDLWLLDVGNMIQFTSNSGTGTAITASPRPIESWTSIAVTYTGTAQTLYIDDVQAAMTVAGTITYGANHVMCVGCRLSQSPTTYFAGSVDDVYVFDQVLTQAEIAAYVGSAH